MDDDLLIDSLATAGFAISTWCCLDQLVTATVFVHDFDTHFGAANLEVFQEVLVTFVDGSGVADVV